MAGAQFYIVYLLDCTTALCMRHSFMPLRARMCCRLGLCVTWEFTFSLFGVAGKICADSKKNDLFYVWIRRIAISAAWKWWLDWVSVNFMQYIMWDESVVLMCCWEMDAAQMDSPIILRCSKRWMFAHPAAIRNTVDSMEDFWRSLTALRLLRIKSGKIQTQKLVSNTLDGRHIE